MKVVFKRAFNTSLVLLVTFFAFLLVPKACDRVLYNDLVPPSSVQTFDHFLQWQIPIERCYEVTVRGVTYYRVIGPFARILPSGGALYVFDAKGNYVGWSRDSGDIMREEAVFYPDFWLPDGSYSVSKIKLDELKERIQGDAAGAGVEQPMPTTVKADS